MVDYVRLFTLKILVDEENVSGDIIRYLSTYVNLFK